MAVNLLPNDSPIDMEQEYITYTFTMSARHITATPIMKMPHFRFCRIRWLSFKSPVDKGVLFLSINGLGNKWEEMNYGTPGFPFPQKYFFSMPIEKDQKIVFNIPDERSYWIKIPEGTNLKTLNFAAWANGESEGTVNDSFVNSTHPVVFALDFKL